MKKEALGFNLTYHPLQRYESYIKEHKLQTIEDIQNVSYARFFRIYYSKESHKKLNRVNPWHSLK